jgi:hypothetical protein
MKSRPSLAGMIRRASQKPEENTTGSSSLSPGKKESTPGFNANGEDDTPMPEPMAIGGGAPRPSTIGSDLGAAKGSEPPTSPTGRKKSIVNLTKKGSDSALNVAGSGSDSLGASDELGGQVFPSSIREGFLKKKGVVNLAWKKRYMVLLPHQLAYYDEKPKAADAAPKGFMRLGAILKVEHHSSDSKTDFKFDVVTPTRIYQLQADSVQDMDAWIASITGTAANEQQVAASRRRNVSHAALAMSETERLKADESFGISREASELRNWPSWNSFEVAAWLQTFGMARYSPTFYEAGVNGGQLKTMNADFLAKNCSVTDKGDQTKILASIKKLMADTATTAKR